MNREQNGHQRVVSSEPGQALMESPILKQPDAEEELIVLLIADGAVSSRAAENYLEEVSGYVRPEDFSNIFCERIYRVILDLTGRGVRSDPLMIDTELRKLPGYSKEDLNALWALVRQLYAPHALERVRALADAIVEASSRRHLLEMLSQMALQTIDPERDPLEVAQETERLMAKTRASYAGADNTIEAIAKDYRAQLKEWRANPFALRGTTTGLKNLDNATSGVKRGDLWVIGARMSMGKSALALSLLLAGARDCGPGIERQVGMVSLEMTSKWLFHRLTSMVSAVAASTIEAGDPRADWERVEAAMDELEQLPLRIIDAGGATNRLNGSRGKMTPEEIRRHALAWHREKRLDLLIVDYLEIVKPPAGMEKEKRDIQLGAIAQAFKDLATELDIPVILLAQINREGERSGSKIPTLASLRYSDEPVAIADVVIFPVRWDYYKERGESVPLEVADKPKGITDLVIAKQRNGKVGTVPIFYAGHLMRFFDWDEQRNCPVSYKGEPLQGLMNPPIPKALQPR